MRIQTLAGTRTLSGEPPRSTAYYYADLERIKRKNAQEATNSQDQDLVVTRCEVESEYVEANEAINDGAVSEVPPLRDRVRQWSLPEYNTPENRKPEETYSTAGTFPMREPKEKEPLLAELEVVGRLPLTQLESSSGVRRSRSWYLCCPNVADEEISRESSWRYSSLRPVTAPPLPGQNGFSLATQSSGRESASGLRAERDSLALALAAERQRAAAEARAHDARLAELHGVIAELLRRRDKDKHAAAIPEEELSDECESTTQPAGELDNDADRSRTDQNDSSSILSPADLPTPQESKVPPDLAEDSSDSSHEPLQGPSPRVQVSPPPPPTDESLNLSERYSELCLNTGRCCQSVRQHSASADSCERDHGSSEGARLYPTSPGRCETRQAKIASRVQLKRTEDTDSNQLSSEEAWCMEAAERLAQDVCAQADYREALVSARHDSSCSTDWRLRCGRLRAERRVLRAALARATDTAHRLYTSCLVQESSAVSLCCALKAADRALEVYDVLLALAETQSGGEERAAAEQVAEQVLCRLRAEDCSPRIGEPLLSPGPWLQHTHRAQAPRWSAGAEAELRAAAARLKGASVTLRQHTAPAMFTYHDIDEEDLPKSPANFSMVEMEAAVTMQDALIARERAEARGTSPYTEPNSTPVTGRRHWLEPQSSETDL